MNFSYIKRLLIKKTYTSKWYLFVLGMVVYSFIALIIVSPIIIGLNSIDKFQPFLGNYTPKERFVLAVLLAPLIETLVLQSFLNSILSFIKIKTTIAILLSSIVFSLTHMYSWSYAFSNLINGIVFNQTYFITKRRIGESPFINSFMVHSIHNLVLVSIMS